MNTLLSDVIRIVPSVIVIMSTNTRVVAKPLGLVLPNFARNKLAAITAATNGSAAVTNGSTIVPTKAPIPIVMPRSSTHSTHSSSIQSIVVARPTLSGPTTPTTPTTPLIQNRVTLVIPRPQTINSTQMVIPVTQPLPLIMPQINSPKVPKVIKPYSPQLIAPQLIAPRLSPSRPLITTHSHLVPMSPNTSTSRSNRITISNSSDIVINDNPWMPPKSETDSLLIKVAAMTPIGTIAMVPTADKRPPQTPRRRPATPGHNVTLKIIEEQDPLMNATIYLDVGHNDDRGYTYVSDHMRSIAATTSDLQKRYATQYRPLPKIQGRVTAVQFEDLLNIYENNQVFYQDRLDDKQVGLVDVEHGLTQLEHWFMRIIEPVPTNDFESWKQREQTKILKGYSAYCDPELYKHIAPASNILRNEIQVL